MAREIIVHDQGYLEIVRGTRSYLSDEITAIVVDTAHTPDVAEDEYSDVSGDECGDTDYSQQEVEGKTMAYNVDNEVKVTHDKVNFTADAPGGRGTMAGRFVYYLFGAPGALAPTSRILAHLDLNAAGGENVSSENGEFSVTPHADGLYVVGRPEPV